MLYLYLISRKRIKIKRGVQPMNQYLKDIAKAATFEDRGTMINYGCLYRIGDVIIRGD